MRFVRDSLKLKWVAFSLWFQNFIISFFKFILFRNVITPKKILVFRTGSIGDNICAIPPIVAIREYYRDAEVHLLTDAGSQNFASLNSLLSAKYYDEVIDYAGLKVSELFWLIRRNKYDLVIELPQNIVTLALELRNMIFFSSAGVINGFGWHITTYFTFLQTQEKHLQFETETKNLLGIIASHGVVSDGVNKYPLRLARNDETIVDDLLKATGSTFTSKKIVAIVPGSKRVQNRYPFERFKVLSKWLIARGYSIAIIGGPDDVARGSEIEEENEAVSFCGKLTPIQSAILLSKCFLTISNDTGPMHLSYAVGTPVLGLFSSRDFQEKWFPPEGSIALRNYDVHCSLCFSETCGNNICMQGISLESVKASFIKLEQTRE